MLFIRSLIFNIGFYVGTTAFALGGLPVLLRDDRAVMGLARAWARYVDWLLRNVCGLRAEFRGVENIPPGGCIIASKHQSAWETLALLRFTPYFSYILKRELLRIPVFGWYLQRARQVAIDRAQGASALSQLVAKSRPLLAKGGRVFIFPEGTRRPAGAPARYKFGVAQLYAEAGVPCVPVAHNAGLFWPRHSFLRRPGVILVEILEPIQPGLDRAAFFALLQSRMEDATNRLIAESLTADPSLRVNLDAGRSDSGPGRPGEPSASQTKDAASNSKS